MISNKEKSKLLGDAFLMTGASIATFVLAIPSSIVSAKLLGPSLLGIVKILSLLQTYASYSQLGFLNAIKRQTAISLGEGDQKKAKEIADISLTNAFILLIFILMAGWVCYWYGTFESKGITFLMMIFITIIIVLNRIRNSISSYLVATENFKAIALNDSLAGALGPILVILFVYYYRSVEAVLIASIITSTVIGMRYIYVLRKINFSYRIKIKVKKSLEIWKPNAIIYVNNLSGQILWTIDLLIISVFLSTKEVAWYGVALAATKIAQRFSTSVNKPILRKITFERGKHGLTNLEWIKPYFGKPLTIYIFYCSLWAGIICLSYTWVIQYYLTGYRESIIPLFVLTIGLMIYGSRPMFGFYINVTDQFRVMVFSRIFFICFNLGFDILAIKLGYGINGVAAVSSASYAIFVVFITMFVFRQIYENPLKRSFAFLAKLFSVSGTLLLFIWLYYSRIMDKGIGLNPINKIPELMLVNGAYAVFIVLIFSILFRSHRIHVEVVTLTKTFLSKSLKLKEAKA